jgi:predicted  nucleic acid-binding Zn-ribbon protein
MRDRDIQTINDNIRELQDLKDDLDSLITKFQTDIEQIEKDLNRQFALTHIITNIKSILNQAITDSPLDFIDDIDSECSELYYKYKSANKSNEVAAFRKVINPAFYNPKDY